MIDFSCGKADPLGVSHPQTPVEYLPKSEGRNGGRR